MDAMHRHSEDRAEERRVDDGPRDPETELNAMSAEDPKTLVTDAAPVEARVAEPKAPDPAKADPTPAVVAPTEDAGPPKKLKPRLRTVLLMILVAIVGVGIILYAWREGPFASTVIATENSYVRGQITVLAPQVNGYVTDVLVKDYQSVRSGDPLLKIDDRIYSQQLEQAEAAREQALANLANADQTVAQNEAEIGARQADLFQAQAELARAEAESGRSTTLTKQGLKPQAQTDQVQATLRTAQAGIQRAEAAINIAQQTLRSTVVSKRALQAAVRTAEAQVHLANINLSNTVIRAPRDGQLSEATVRPGQYVAAGSQLLFLVPDTLWVVANFKETQTHYIAVGQKASFKVDALGGRRFTGTVIDIAPATGSEFSVLRADNASGNFTKVVQRVPVRIAIDPSQPEAGQLRPGLSVVADVDTSGRAPERTGWWAKLRLPEALRAWIPA